VAAGFVSGSADHELKFWEWQLVSGDAEAAGGSAVGAAARRLTVRHTRTLKMTDDVLCVRISPNGASLMLVFVGDQSVASLFVCSVEIFLAQMGRLCVDGFLASAQHGPRNRQACSCHDTHMHAQFPQMAYDSKN